MTSKPETTLNPRLIEKLIAMDLEDLADALCADPEGARRILAAEVEQLETEITHEPEWPLAPVAEKEDEVYVIDVPSRKRHLRQSIRFLTTTDFKHLAVPIGMLPGDCLPDPVLQKYHWWRGTGSDKLGTIEAVRALAKRIVRQYDGLDKAPVKPKDLDLRFEITTPKASYTFMTRFDWKGLWCPLVMKPDGKPDARTAMFTKVLKEEEIQGKREVKKYARKMANDFDKIKVKPKPPAFARGPYKGMYIPIPYQDMWESIRLWMAHGRLSGCSRSQVIQNLLHDQFDRLPPESEWAEKPYQWRKEEGE